MELKKQRKFVVDSPVVLKRKGKKKKRRRRTSVDGELENLERNLVKAVRRTLRGVDRGMATYRKASKRSSKRNRSGATVDFIPNFWAGTGEALREISMVPADLARAANTPQVRRLTRRSIRALIDPLDRTLEDLD